MIQGLLKQANKFASDNSTTILTSVGVVGVITTAALSIKATFAAADLIMDESERRLLSPEDQGPFTPKDKINLVWREYIPAVAVGAGTITAIIMTNKIGGRRTAAMTAAFTLSEKAMVEYKDKVVETIGKNKAQEVHDSVAQDMVGRTPVPANLIVMGVDKQLCFDALSGRYFQSTMEDLKKAMNDLNYCVLHDNYASLSDFYDLLDLEHTQMSDDIGWNVSEMMEIVFSGCVSPDQRPAISISYVTEPIRGFHRLA